MLVDARGILYTCVREKERHKTKYIQNNKIAQRATPSPRESQEIENTPKKHQFSEHFNGNEP